MAMEQNHSSGASGKEQREGNENGERRINNLSVRHDFFD